MDSAVTAEEMKQAMSEAIREMQKIIASEDATENQKSQAVNAMSGLANRYDDIFGFTDEEKSNLKSVKNF